MIVVVVVVVVDKFVSAEQSVTAGSRGASENGNPE